MTSATVVGISIAIFVVAALLYFQSRQPLSSSKSEHFVSGSLAHTTWNPSKPPIAGRLYDPGISGPVPGDLNRAPPVNGSTGSIPLSQQRPSQTPTGGSATMPRDALAQIKDLRELDSKIVTWLDAAGQRERDTPGSLTAEQRQERVMLMARLNDVRDQIGSGTVTDSWKLVSEETRRLRDENAGWGQIAPSLEAVNSFGQGTPADALLTPAQFSEFNALFNSAIREFQGLAQPEPLQKVRLQQLQVIRQELMDGTGSKGQAGNPPIRMGAAQQFLRQMLKPDQPLPSLVDFSAGLDDNTMGSLMSFVLIGRPKETLQHHYQEQQAQDQREQGRYDYYDPTDIIKNTVLMCARVREAFGFKDAAALGCPTPQTHPFGIRDKREAESVMRTVCNRIRESVPTVTPEQFGCGTL